MSKKDVFEVSGISAEPGRLAKGFIKVGEFFDNSPVNMPVMILNGVDEGPTVLIMSALHGNEVVGTEAIKRIMTDINPDELKGTVIGIPVVNIPAYLMNARVNILESPAGENDLLGMMATGVNQGPQTQIISNILHEKFFKKSDYVIDLHSSAPGSYNYPRAIIVGEYAPVPQALRDKCNAVGEACNYEFVFKPGKPKWDGMYFNPPSMFEEKYGIPSIILETGAAPTTEDVETLIEGIDNILKHLRMIAGEPRKKNKQVYIDRLVAVRAKHGGIFRLTAKMPSAVKEGDIVGEITNLFNDVIETIRVPEDGIVIKAATSALIATGVRAVVLGIPAS